MQSKVGQRVYQRCRELIRGELGVGMIEDGALGRTPIQEGTGSWFFGHVNPMELADI